LFEIVAEKFVLGQGDFCLFFVLNPKSRKKTHLHGFAARIFTASYYKSFFDKNRK